jgi:hypothetical protein
LINPINNEIIEGNCSFIKNNDYDSYDYYYDNRPYYFSCHIFSNLFEVRNLEIHHNYLDKKNNSLPDINIRTYNYDKAKIYLPSSLICAKSSIFTINEIRDKNCFDGTYVFKMIGTLSKRVEYSFNITIRDTIENEIQIFCNNLLYYGFIDNQDHYSFDCYVVNETSNDYLNITLLDTPPNSDIISVKYSPQFNNKKIDFNFKCYNEDKSQDFEEEFNSTLSLFYLFNRKTNLDADTKEINFKVIAKADKYPNKKINEVYNKYMGKYLTLIIDDLSGVALCNLNGKNITNATILKCRGICGYEYNLEKIKFDTINSLNIFGDETNSPNICFMGFIDKEPDKEEPKFRINYISKSNICINDTYNFNISGEIIGDTKDFYKSIPSYAVISLVNNLYAVCYISNINEINLQLKCFVESRNALINEDIQFNLSQIEKDENNILYFIK